jgi:hypothetical protein
MEKKRGKRKKKESEKEKMIEKRERKRKKGRKKGRKRDKGGKKERNTSIVEVTVKTKERARCMFRRFDAISNKNFVFQGFRVTR